MLTYLIGGILCAATLYMFIPSLITRVSGFGVFRKGTVKKQVAFTFDDGPHPKYTPELLDLLKLHQVKATFSCLDRERSSIQI